MPADISVQVRLDPRQMRVLAHPLRARLLGQLRLGGPATATRLAEVLATNTGATSYHLRQLAEVGLVREDDHPGRGRERWWRAAHDVSSWRPSDYAGDADAAAAAEWLHGYALRRFVEQAQRWTDVAAEQPQQWQDAAALSDYALMLSAPQLRALTAELDEVVEKHRRAAAAATPAADARQVLFFLYGFPHQEPA